jgi:DNA-binding beta-propeller fold protein YncE
MPANRKYGLVGAGAAVMFLASCVHLLFRASPRILSLSTPSTVAAANTPDDDDDSCADTTDLAMAMTAWKQVQQRKADPVSASVSASVSVSAAVSVSGATAPVGGDIAPARTVADAYPSFHSVAVDPAAGQVVISDSNRGAILLYDRASGDNSHRMVSPNQEIRGPRTGMMFVAGISVDPSQREIFAVNNDIGDRMEVFSYDMEGNIKPKRVLSVPHGVWGVSFDAMRQEVAISVEHPNTVVVYRRDASGSEAPLRVLHGRETELADPHGIVTDAAHNEMLVANHGNWAPLTREEEEALGGSIGGHFALPSINTYGVEAKGDEKPVRKIQGAQTQLNWPMGMSLDTVHDEIAVANYGTNSVLFFRRDASGNVAPVRVIKGNRTGIKGPMGVAIDVKNDELWVTNYSEHTAVVFARTASGNVAPKRVLRNAPEGTPAVGFGNPGAIAYDSKRDQILVPN